MTRVRFDLLIEHAIRDRREGVEQLRPTRAYASNPKTPQTSAYTESKGENLNSLLTAECGKIGTELPSDEAASKAGELPRAAAGTALGARHYIKRLIQYLAKPFKPLARYFRRFMVAPLEERFANLNAQNETMFRLLATNNDIATRELKALSNALACISNEMSALRSCFSGELTALEARQEDLARLMHGKLNEITFLHGKLNEITLLHGKLGEIALRERGPLAIDDALFALRTYDGFVLVPRQDPLLLLMLHDAGPQGLEPGTRRVLCKLLSPGMTFIDIGAHIGLLTIAGARAVGRGGKVIALEPVPLLFSLLNRALAINGLNVQVETRQQAVGARRGRANFYVASILGHSSLFPPGGMADRTTQIEVEVLSLDELIPERGRVDVVKIDVEGAELAVLEGMRRVVSENRNLAIIAEFGPSHLKGRHTTPEEWMSAFWGLGFESFVIDELTAECHPANLPDLVNVESVNILFVRQTSPMLARALS